MTGVSMAWVAALCAGVAAWWLVPGASEGMGRLAGVPTAPHPGRHRPPRWGLAALVAAGAVLAAALLAGPGGAAATLALGQVVGCLVVLAARRAARAARARGRAAVVHAGELVAGLLRVGRVPSAALVEAAEDAPVLRVAASELVAGGDAPAALRRSAGEAGHEGLRDLAAAWEVSVRTGASLVAAVDAAAARLAAEQDVARVVDAELAAARLGGRVMAALPLVGLLLGFGLGGDPIAFLLGSLLGWTCLNVGVGLACGGVLWIDTVAERSGGR